METLSTFTKKKNWLICVDSDGCAMDTMDIKHIRCFGPCMVREWALEQWQAPILARWNEINLYTLTRGINRFKGLAIALEEIHNTYCKIDGIRALKAWVGNSKELSNDALKREIEASPNENVFKKALAWSLAVNTAINLLPEEEKMPFEKAKDALAFAHKNADVAVVSSANLDAVMEEWEKYGLLPHVDIVLSQNAGSKAFCIQELLKKGYDPCNVLMCGDAPGDMQAAEKNGVFYFPILVRREKESWEEFIGCGLQKLLDGEYGGVYQQTKKTEFLQNLGAKE